MSQHTPGRLTVAEDGVNLVAEDGFCIAGAEVSSAINLGWAVLGIQHWSQAPGTGYRDLSAQEEGANAARLAACWNAGLLLGDDPEAMARDLVTLVHDLARYFEPSNSAFARRGRELVARLPKESAP